jgi:hypothetical protein
MGKMTTKKPILSGNPTKKFLFSLGAGDYLVSNVVEALGQPTFAQIIKPKEHRETKWKEIVAARANGRLCHVFNSAKDYVEFSLEVPFSLQRN